jgi:hypothetical protein
MFFEEAVGASSPVEPALSLSKGPTARRQPSRPGLGIDSPTLSERRRRGTLSPQPASLLCRESICRKGPQNRRSLGFAPSSNEQTIAPAGFLLEWHGRLRFAVSHISRKTREIWGTPHWLLGESQTGAVHFVLNLTQASRLLGMTRGRVLLSLESVDKQKPFFITLGGKQAHDSVGGDDEGNNDYQIRRTTTK